MILARVMELTEQLGQHKRLAVGHGGPIPPIPVCAANAADIPFGDAVSIVWKWYNETLSHDLEFLLPRATSGEKIALSSFKRILDNQRHDKEHAGFSRAAEAEAWRARQAGGGEVASDQLLVDGLLGELEAALECLNLIAQRMHQDQEGSEAWRKHVALSPEGEMRAVLEDIGCGGLSQKRVDYAVRRFKSHPHLKRAMTQEDRARIAAVVALEISLDPLSVQYDKILDEFGLICNPLGRALLIVAHGAEAVGYRGDDLIAVLHRMWPECMATIMPR